MSKSGPGKREFEDTSKLKHYRPAKYRRTENLGKLRSVAIKEPEVAYADIHLPDENTTPTISYQNEPTDERSESDTDSEYDFSDSSSEVSETESEMEALEAEDKRKYITFTRGGFGPVRGPDGKFPELPSQGLGITSLPVTGSNNIMCPRTGPKTTDQKKTNKSSSLENEDHDLKRNTSEELASPTISIGSQKSIPNTAIGLKARRGITDSSATQTKDQSSGLPNNENQGSSSSTKHKKQSKTRFYGSKISEVELAQMIEDIPDKDDLCFKQEANRVYLPRHASYTSLVYDLEKIGYTRRQILWLFGAYPEPMIPNVLWMRLKRYKASKGYLD